MLIVLSELVTSPVVIMLVETAMEWVSPDFVFNLVRRDFTNPRKRAMANRVASQVADGNNSRMNSTMSGEGLRR